MPRRRHRFQCQECGAAFWTYEPDQQTCTRSCAAKRRVKLKGFGGLQPGNNEHIPPPPIKLPPSREPTSRVERMLAKARDLRLRWEREHGRRVFRIEDGWMQRPGVSTLGDSNTDGGQQ
jgi:hypothetical protein